MTDSTGLTGQILLYRSEDGRTRLDVRLDNATVWLNQRQLTELFGKAKGTISEHIKHIFEDGMSTKRSLGGQRLVSTRSHCGSCGRCGLTEDAVLRKLAISATVRMVSISWRVAMAMVIPR